MNPKINILFLCVANSARSQMAEFLLKHLYANEFNVYSAGSKPSGVVNPLAIQVLTEQCISTEKNYSKSLSDLPTQFLENLDFVITLCQEEECPFIFSKAKQLHWPFQDPKDLDTFRLVRDQIKSKIIDSKMSLIKMKIES